MPRRTVLTGLVTAALALAGCASADPRRAVAEQFIERLFVTIDQPAARQLATGLAVTKLDEEIRLKQGQAIDESTEQPRIHYRFLQVADGEGAETSSLRYELTVASHDSDAFNRRLILTLRRVDGDWRVANYTLESPPVPG